jgi:hypothetical protein
MGEGWGGGATKNIMIRPFDADLKLGEHILRLWITDKKNEASVGHAMRIIQFVVNRPTGERGGVGAVLCSNYRNHPPGKPGAFVKCQNEF